MNNKKTNGYHDDINVIGSDEKFKNGKSYGETTKGKVSDDKISRSSHSLDSENDGKVIR